MLELSITTIIWAFSFSFIGMFLAKDVDPYIAVVIRFVLAFLVLLPFLKLRNLPKSFIFKVMGIGAIQVGLMFLAFYNSFLFISVPEVILFTVMTPLYVTLLNDILNKKLNFKLIPTALLAIAGAAIIKWTSINENFVLGFTVVQLANISFALGQVLYRRLMLNTPAEIKNDINDRNIFSLFYLGALLITVPTMLIFSNFSRVPTTNTHYAVLLWLGLMASGVGYVLWNKGSQKVKIGTLSVMNNAVVPLGIIVSFIFGSTINNEIQFGIGTSLILLALYLNQKVLVK